MRLRWVSLINCERVEEDIDAEVTFFIKANVVYDMIW